MLTCKNYSFDNSSKSIQTLVFLFLVFVILYKYFSINIQNGPDANGYCTLNKWNDLKHISKALWKLLNDINWPSKYIKKLSMVKVLLSPKHKINGWMGSPFLDRKLRWSSKDCIVELMYANASCESLIVNLPYSLLPFTFFRKNFFVGCRK